jgi:FAD/FMN-containing dehydrogenase/Fe-S oxidoreductase
MRHYRHRIERDLRALLKGDVEFDRVSRYLYSTDAGLSQILPLGVVSPRDTDDVERLVRYAAERGLPLVPRGAGSGLAGGAVGEGLQVDFSRYMNRILEFAEDGSSVRVQPGLTMGSLNQAARELGRFFAPDPSSENYCSLGGMVGTNSSGARSVAYGSTKDHVLSLELVMADGSRFSAGSMTGDSPQLARLLSSGTLAGRAFSSILPQLTERREEILASLPRVVKNCCGYRIEAVTAENGQLHPQKLFVGAEGTLGLVTEMNLRLLPLPGRRGICMVYFPSVFACGEAVDGILALAPTAVEIMDSRFLGLVRSHYSQVDAMLPPQTDTALLIEFEAENDELLDERFRALRRHLDGGAALKMVRPADEAEANLLWRIRKSAVALAQRAPGPRRALPFIEDVTVHPSEVPAYIDFLQKLFDRYQLDAVMVGHVGDGNIHTRPRLDPKDSADMRVMDEVAEEVSRYVLSVRGTWSGEHGDGLARTPYVRRLYGPRIYSLFEGVKEAFDPQGILNPGKKTGPQLDAVMPQPHLRFPAHYRTLPQNPRLNFGNADYELEIEKCHGCANCKSTVETTMCPIYKATRREHASPRAKANLLRSIITGELDPEGAYGSAAVKQVTDYCIVCGMCAVECPSNVNIPKLMLEAKSRYREKHRGGPADILLGHAETASKWGARTSRVTNRIVNQPLLRRLGQPLTGVDRRRVIAEFAASPFAEAAPAVPTRVEAEQPGIPTHIDVAAHRRVAYFYDLFANFNDPELARKVVKVLRAHGLEVVLPPQKGSGVPEMLNGYADAARRAAEANVLSLAASVDDGDAPVASEPTASFAFKVHYPDYLGGQACSKVANAIHDLGEFLVRFRADHPDDSPCATALPPGSIAELAARAWTGSDSSAPGATLRVAYHLPCHLRAQQVGSPALELLAEIPGLELINLDAGCCGMAGTFGMKRTSYDLSLTAGGPVFDRIAQVKPDLVATECSTCRMQIEQATGLPAIHPIMILAAAYGLAR